MDNLNLVRMFLRHPNIVFEDTLKVVSCSPTEGVTYELNTIVAKVIELGRIFLYILNLLLEKL